MQRVIFAGGAVLGAMSVLSLSVVSLDLGMSALISEVYGFYNQFVSILLGWAEPHIYVVLNAVGAWAGVDLDLDASWRHVLVILMIYFSADARASASMGRAGFAIFSLIWALLIGVLGAVATGTRPVEGTALDVWAVALPIMTVVIFEFGRTLLSAAFRLPTPSARSGTTRPEIFKYLILRFPIAIGIIGVVNVASVIALFNQGEVAFGNANLAALGSFLVSLILYFLVRAGFAAMRPADGRSRLLRLRQSGSFEVAMLMASTLAGGVVLIVMNAGLSRVGL